MGRQRWLQLFLILSLSGNLLIVGPLASRYWQREPPLGWAVRQLDDQTRAAIRPILRQQGERGFKMRRALRQRRARIRDLMAEETLDKAALEEELSMLRALSAEYQTAIHETAVDVLATLPPDQRQRVAHRLLAPQPERREPGRGGPPPPRP